METTQPEISPELRNVKDLQQRRAQAMSRSDEELAETLRVQLCAAEDELERARDRALDSSHELIRAIYAAQEAGDESRASGLKQDLAALHADVKQRFGW